MQVMTRNMYIIMSHALIPHFSKPTHITNETWEPHTYTQPCYMKIDQFLQVHHEKLRENRFNFWEKWTKRSYW